MRWFLAFLFVIAAALGGLWWWLQDANRLKQQLESAATEAAGFPVTVEGDLAWVLWPPLTARAESLKAIDEDTEYRVGKVEVKVNLLDFYTDIEQWRVQSVALTDVSIRDEDGVTELPSVTVDDFKPGSWAHLTAVLRQPHSSDLTLEGQMQYRDNEGTTELAAQDLQFANDDMSGACDVDLTATGDLGTYEEHDDDLLPVNTLRGYNWNGSCSVTRFSLDETTELNDISLTLQGRDGIANTQALIPSFFGGRVSAEIEHNVAARTPRWHIKPQLSGVNSQALMDWLGQAVEWQGSIDGSGEFHLKGNNVTALAKSLNGSFQFDGGTGTINIAKIKQQMQRVAALNNKRESVDRWPEQWDYQHFVGTWNVLGEQNRFDIDLDNLAIDAQGVYAYAENTIDFNSTLTFGDDAQYSKFDVNPLLVGFPIPMRCRGSADDPQCRVDEQAAIAAIGSAIASGEDSALRQKIEEKIEEDVPEEYREVARGLLDLIGGALGGDKEEQEPERKDDGR